MEGLLYIEHSLRFWRFKQIRPGLDFKCLKSSIGVGLFMYMFVFILENLACGMNYSILQCCSHVLLEKEWLISQSPSEFFPWSGLS